MLTKNECNKRTTSAWTTQSIDPVTTLIALPIALTCGGSSLAQAQTGAVAGVVLTRRQGPFFVPTNAGEQRYKGFAIGVSVAITPKVSAFANAAFYRNRFGEFVIQSEGGDEVLTGNRLPISPNYVVNWGVTFLPYKAVDATVNVKHLGSVAADRENTFEIDPYTLVDAAVTWRRGPLRVTVSGRNLFNPAYYWNADGETADPGRPRQILATMTVSIK